MSTHAAAHATHRRHHAAPTLATPDNVRRLARILTSEASVGNDAEQTAVAWTVRNRLQRNHSNVHQEQHAYATDQHATHHAERIAREVLNGTRPDNTGGATHFYSPRAMPAEGADTAGYDVGQLEQINGLDHRNYQPSWAQGQTAAAVTGARDAYYRFYNIAGHRVR